MGFEPAWSDQSIRLGFSIYQTDYVEGAVKATYEIGFEALKTGVEHYRA